MNQTNPYRLPHTVAPRHYDLTLEPDLAAARFSGTCEVTVEVLEETSAITVNAAELTIGDVSVSDGSTDLAGEVSYEEEHERATFQFDESLAPGTWTLRTEFDGVLNDKLRGFYRSTYTDTDGHEVTLATTQFESTNARRAFPCWDEPDLKAVFEVTLVVPDDLLAVTCTGEVSEEPTGDGRRRVRYAPTPLMSTYLLAFVVGPLEASDAIDVDGIPLRVIYPRGKGDLAAFAAEVGAFSLRWFTEYFDFPYPGDKLDLVAIPDFAFGAMENLGCVTFREILLLAEPEQSTQSELQRITDVIAHEIAHMWFGDLVTMKWWNGIWLKEAFATFMEMLLTDAFRPEWERWVSFGLSRSAAFDVDSLQETRPIEYPVVSPADAEGMYDLLTYEKGAAVVRMLEQYLGASDFREGIRHYISQHAFANTDTHDLWDAIETATDAPVRQTMDGWIFQGGYPLVELASEGGDLRISQRRFSYGAAPSSDASWNVPLILTHGAGPDRSEERILLEDAAMVHPAELEGGWVIANTAGSGFYRVRYDNELTAAILDNLFALDPVERYGFVDDAWAAVLAGLDGITGFLELTRRFGSETDLSVWQRLSGALSTVDDLLEPAVQNGFEEFVRELCTPTFEALGWSARDDDSDRDNELRGTLISVLGNLGGDPSVIARCEEIESSGEGQASVVSAAISVTARHGDASTYERFRETMAAPSSPQHERRYQQALALFQGRAEFDRTIAATSDGSIRTQDAPFVLGQLLAHARFGAVAWEHVKANWDELNERFPDNSIPRMLGGIVKLDTPDLAADTRNFIAGHPVPQGIKIVAQHLEKQDVNVALRLREVPELTAYFG